MLPSLADSSKSAEVGSTPSWFPHTSNWLGRHGFPLSNTIEMETRVLSKEDESSEKILKDDQEKINMFARLNNRLGDVKEELQSLQKQKDNLDDASTELALAEDSVKFQVGEVYVDVSTEEAEKLVAQLVEEMAGNVTRLETEKKSILDKMNGLKVQLYAKFGRSINLETDPDE